MILRQPATCFNEPKVGKRRGLSGKSEAAAKNNPTSWNAGALKWAVIFAWRSAAHKMV
jgi:hypothetical protein